MQAYCGFKHKLPSEGKKEIWTTCSHPAWLEKKDGSPVPSTVNPRNGAWLREHADQHSPRKPTPHDPRIIAKFFGCDFSQLTDLSMRLRKAADGDSVSLAIPFTLDVLANQAELSHLPGAVAVNNKRADAASHYPMISSKCDSAKRALEHVFEMMQDDQEPGELKRLAALVDHACLLLQEAFHAMVQPVMGGHGLVPHASPLPPGEPV